MAEDIYASYTMTEENAASFADWCEGKLVQEFDALDSKITHWAVNYQGVDDVERAHAGDTLVYDPENEVYVKL